jgi:hypothetical protein
VIQIDVRGIADVQRQFRLLAQEQMPYALMTALNSTAFAVQKESRKRLETVFDRPTPLIKGATRVEKATKQNLTAVVLIDPKRAAVLQAHEYGGRRGDQRLERYLTGKGWLPAGYRAVPTDKMPLDNYGNPKKAEVNKIIAGLPNVGGVKGQARRYFVIRSGQSSHLSPGVYRQVSKGKGATLMKLYHFASRAEYRARLEWLPRMEQAARGILPGLAAQAIQRAIATAR